MGRHWFSPAVSVETAKPGQPCAVNSVEKAAEQLFAWPDRGPEWREAVDSCADALTGQISVAQVRAAFLVAARAAGRLIDPDQLLRPRSRQDRAARRVRLCPRSGDAEERQRRPGASGYAPGQKAKQP